MTPEIADRPDGASAPSGIAFIKIPPRRKPGLPPITTVEVAGKTVLLRADLNVPMRGNLVEDRTLIRRLVPTINVLVARGAGVVVMAHLGDPRGEPNPVYSLAPIASAL